MPIPSKLLLLLITFISIEAKSQIYPSFGPEINVTINGLSFDAMEPFISANGNYLFFNNLNDGINTKLYYATKLNDSTFLYVGELNGANQTSSPQLDAVPDMDSSNNFYWTSTRNYPAELNNLFHGTFNNGTIGNISRIYGDFNKYIPGWLVMDHGISYDGQFLYYNNARLDNNNCAGPCETEIGIAQKVNDSTFNKTPNSNSILQNINDTNYIYYAPFISSDNLEFYYTRYLKGTITSNTSFEICVAIRNTPSDTFSTPMVLFTELISDLIEAPTLTTDKQIIYYHRKIVGTHKIVMRYRTISLNIITNESSFPYIIYPNPSNKIINIKTELTYQSLKLSIFTLLGEKVIASTNQTHIDISNLSAGTYFLRIEIDGKLEINKIIKTK